VLKGSEAEQLKKSAQIGANLLALFSLYKVRTQKGGVE